MGSRFGDFSPPFSLFFTFRFFFFFGFSSSCCWSFKAWKIQQSFSPIFPVQIELSSTLERQGKKKTSHTPTFFSSSLISVCWRCRLCRFIADFCSCLSSLWDELAILLDTWDCFLWDMFGLCIETVPAVAIDKWSGSKWSCFPNAVPGSEKFHNNWSISTKLRESMDRFTHHSTQVWCS